MFLVYLYRMSGAADIYLLYDVSGGSALALPSWIQEQGFSRVEDMLITVSLPVNPPT